MVIVNSYYDGDQERLFLEAHVVNPFRAMTENARAAQVVVLFSHSWLLDTLLVPILLLSRLFI